MLGPASLSPHIGTTHGYGDGAALTAHPTWTCQARPLWTALQRQLRGEWALEGFLLARPAAQPSHVLGSYVVQDRRGFQEGFQGGQSRNSSSLAISSRPSVCKGPKPSCPRQAFCIGKLQQGLFQEVFADWLQVQNRAMEPVSGPCRVLDKQGKVFGMSQQDNDLLWVGKALLIQLLEGISLDLYKWRLQATRLLALGDLLRLAFVLVDRLGLGLRPS